MSKPNAYRFTALCGASFVEGADTLEALLPLVRRCWEAGLGEDVAVWNGARLVHLFLASTGCGGIEVRVSRGEGT